MRSPRGVATDWIRYPRFADKADDAVLNAGVSRANQVRASPTFRHPITAMLRIGILSHAFPAILSITQQRVTDLPESVERDERHPLFRPLNFLRILQLLRPTIDRC
jgi:hypothetical protein